MPFSKSNISGGWKPPPKLTVSEWAAAERRLSSEASAEPGKWRNRRTPYMVEIMDAVTDPAITEITMKTSAQIGKTEFENNVIGYFIAQDPCSMLMVQPTESMSKSWVNERFNPMIRDCPCFKDVLTEDNMLHKSFVGGFLAIGYAKAPSTLASRPIRIVLFDEIDRYDLNIKNEGDPVNIGEKRTTTFHNKKIIKVSTPALKGSSRIDKSYDESDQRIYKVPCPKCGSYHFIDWESIKFDSSDPKGTAVWVCPSCATEIEHFKKQTMLEKGKWEGQQPFNGHAGFHLNELYSPWVTWGEVADSYLKAKTTEETKQTWVNLSMGISYEPKSQKVDSSTLSTLKEGYTAELLPRGVLWLAAGVDTQNDRFEVDIWGFGFGEEAWFVESKIILGDPSKQETRDELDQYLLTTWRTEAEYTLPINTTFIDSGGQRTKYVYDFVRGKAGRRIFAIKGASTENPYDNNVEVSKQGYSKKYRCSLVMLHVSKLKLQFYQRLKQSLASNSEESKPNGGPGYIHFPKDCDDEFFQSLTAEKLSRKTVSRKHVYYWEKVIERNERLDNAIYARAALMQFKPDFDKISENYEKKNKKVPEKDKRDIERAKVIRRRKSWAISC